MPSVMDPEQVHVPGAAGNTDAAGVENRESGRPCTSRALPQIDAGDQDIPRVAKLAWDALERANDPPRLFLHGRQPIRIEGTDHGSPVLQPLSPDRLWHELARAAAWFRMKYNRAVSAKPPRDVVSDMLADPNPRFPVLERIVQVPVFLSNGQLLDAPGYHAQGGVYYVPRPGFDPPSVSAHPTGRDVEMARSLIVEDLLGDFPFTGKAELANAVALLLLPFVRPLIDGPTPLHLVEKPTPGTGAGLMTEVIFSLALGGSPPILTLGSNENETSWTITATLSQSPTVVLIDNVHALSSAALSAAITAEIWSGRIISTSQLARLPVRCAWVATGNNPTLSQEITRRTVRIRLDADVEHPWERTNFRHPDLRGWVRANRSNLVEAALTLIQAWITTGQPNGPVSFGMFEAWSRVLGESWRPRGSKASLRTAAISITRPTTTVESGLSSSAAGLSATRIRRWG